MTHASHRLSRRTALLATLLLAAGVATAQTAASKPLTLIVPYPAGGLSDAVARVIERPLGKALGQMVIVENIGGVGGAIAAQKMLAAPADGGMIYQGSPNELILTPMALQAVKYKSEDFRLLQIVGAAPMAVVVRKDLPAENIDEFVALARKSAAAGKPLTYGSVGVGSLYHVLGEHFAQQIEAPMTHVPYKGGAPLGQDLAGGVLDVSFITVGAQQVALAEQGRIKILGTLAPAGKVEAPFLKRYPSINDSKSVKSFNYTLWTGFFVPKATPEPVAQALHKALTTAMTDPEVIKQLELIGNVPLAPLSLTDAAKEYEAQAARYRAIAKAIKLAAQ